MTGFLAINKPTGPTSHDIVDRIRRITGEKRVGHAGTLDPFASGVLIVGVGREATREFSKLVGLDKRYRAVLRLGATSDTDDRTGVISYGQHTMNNERFLSRPDGTRVVHRPLSIVHDDYRIPAKETILQTLKKFTGKIEQIPPMYSAKKIGGKKLYELARAGQTVERKPSQVEIYSLDLVEAKPRPDSGIEELILDIHCSSGTYIRALARDIGEALPAQGGSASGGGCGAYLEELERTAVGPFGIGETVKIDALSADNVEKHLLAAETALARCQRDRAMLG